MTENKKSWKNRIVETGEKAASEFNYNPGNFRLHNDTQRNSINGILSEVGWVTGVIENKRTGNLIDGHLRIEEALQKGDDTPVPFTLVDLSEEEEKKVLMVLDQIGTLAKLDADKFAELAESINFESDALLDLVARMSSDDLEKLGGEPNLNDPNFDYENKFGVIVVCDDEKHQEQIFNQLQAAGYNVRVVTV